MGARKGLHRLLDFRRDIRDPIYGYIQVTKLENAIMDRPVFQRLGRIRQMHTVDKVYPSATYTRKSHSLGVMNLVHKALSHIFYLQHTGIRESMSPLFFKFNPSLENYSEQLDKLDSLFKIEWSNSEKSAEWVMQAARLAGLLHDIGHGPLSHLFEEIEPTFNHEKMSRRLIKEILCKKDGIIDERMADFVCRILSGDVGDQRRFLHELVNSPWDCDKLDYLVRDSYHCGTMEYGLIDVMRIVRGFVVVEGGLHLSKSQLSAAADGLHSVFYMYNNVYYHKTTRMFDMLYKQAFEKIPFLVEEISSDIETFSKYDDATLFSEIRNRSQNKGDPNRRQYATALSIIEQVRNRMKPYKALVNKPLEMRYTFIKDAATREKLRKELENISTRAKEKARENGFDIIVDLFYEIRAIGISPESVMEWLVTDKLFDPKAKEREKSRIGIYRFNSYYEPLLCLSVPIRMFIPEEAWVTNKRAANRIKKKVEEEIENLRIKYKDAYV